MTNTFDVLIDQEIHCIDNVLRFNKQPVIRNETVSQHQYWVVLFSIVLFDEMFKGIEESKAAVTQCKIMRLAATHDILECITGDVNHDLKYNDFNGLDVKTVLNKYEDEIKARFYKTPHRKAIAKALAPHEPFVECFVKVCDWLSLIKNIQQEVNLGNRNMQNIIFNTKAKTEAAIKTLMFATEQMQNLEADETVLHRLIAEIKLMKI